MRILRFLLIKEFKQIFRNKSLLPMIIVMPILQLLVMPLAADYEIKNINISIVDHNHSTQTNQLINNIIASGYFKLVEYDNSYPNAYKGLESDATDLILEIPPHFEKELLTQNGSTLLLSVNAINGTKANVGAAYLQQIIRQFNTRIRMEMMKNGHSFLPSQIDIVTAHWFNPEMDYRFFMVPGILVVLVTMVGAYMCALNIVKEKEIGTIEQINVTPIKKYQFILGKLIPFWIIGIFIFSVGLFAVSYGVYGIFSQGSLLLLYGYMLIYLIALLGLGLLISTYAETQQQAMSIAFFFMMIFMLMSGLFTPIDSMPDWSKVIAKSNPVTYFIEVTRMIMLKGSTFKDIQSHFVTILGFAVLFNGWAILNYKKTI